MRIRQENGSSLHEMFLCAGAQEKTVLCRCPPKAYRSAYLFSPKDREMPADTSDVMGHPTCRMWLQVFQDKHVHARSACAATVSMHFDCGKFAIALAGNQSATCQFIEAASDDGGIGKQHILALVMGGLVVLSLIAVLSFFRKPAARKVHNLRKDSAERVYYGNAHGLPCLGF